MTAALLEPDEGLWDPVDTLDLTVLPGALRVLVPASGNWTSPEASE